MSDLYRESFPTARKAHRCDDCGRHITPGTRYRRTFIVDGGDTGTWRSHEDCAALAWDLHCEMHGRYRYDEEMTPLKDLDEREYLNGWRGKYPHAVCRTELTWQLAALRRAGEGL